MLTWIRPLALGAGLALAVPCAAEALPDAGPVADAGSPPAAVTDAGAAPVEGNHDEGSMFGASPSPAPAPAPGEGNHDEGSMLGGSTAPSATASPAPSAAATPSVVVDGGEHSGAETAMFGSSTPHDVDNNPLGAVPMDPLKIGGLLYLQSQVSGGLVHNASSVQPPSQWTATMPNLLDLYLDARPNENVRGMVTGRLYFNPLTNPNLTVFGQPAEPTTQVLLDQMWINFNIEHTIFMTVGKQHIKWGTGHFWNPTDFLQPVKLNPFALYDTRTGVTMVKAQVPWEKEGWNFYGYGLLDNATNPVTTVGGVGAAARSEIVLGPAEIGFDGVLRRGTVPHWGIDLSSGLGPLPIDIYAEAAFQDPRQLTEYELRNNQFDPALGLGNYEAYHPTNGLATQVVGGLSYETTVNDNDGLTLGAEYFYNSLGVSSALLYPYLIGVNAFTPFYEGQNYAGVYATLTIPSSNSFASNNFTLSNIGNLTDESFITRLDYNILVLTHLQLELYVDGHYGHNGGELRFGLDTTGLASANGEIPAIFVPTPLFDAGINLRLSI